MVNRLLGPCTKKLENKIEIAKQELQKVIKLIPIYSHRYLPLIKRQTVDSGFISLSNLYHLLWY